MFTFSFSSAFADTASATQKANLLEAEKLALATAEANYKTAMGEIDDQKYGSYFVVEKSVWENLSTEAWAEYVKSIQAKTDAAIANYTYGASTGSALANAVYVDADNASLVSVAAISAWLHTNYDVKAAKVQFKNDQADALAKLDKVDLNLYSATSPKTGDTYRVQAEKAVAAAKTTVNDINIDAVDNAGNPAYASTSAVQTAYENMTGYVNSKITPLTIGTTGILSGFYKLSDSSIKTIEDEEKSDVKDAATKASLKAVVAQRYATYVADTPNADKDGAAKAVEMINFLIDEDAISANTVNEGNVVTAWMVGPYFKNNAEQIEALEAFAAKYKAEKDAEGNLVRDAKDVDDIVKAAKKVAFGNVYAKYDNAADKTKIEKAVKSVNDATLSFTKEVAKTAMEKARKAALKNYYELEQAKVNAEFDKKIADIEKAKTSDEAKAVTAPTLAGIATKATVNGYFTSGALASEFDKMYAGDKSGSLEKYVEYKNAGLTSRNEGYVVADTLEANLIKFYGEKGARTAAEMKALASEATAVVDALPTVGSIAAAKAAVEDAIKALPATITVADKEAVENAWKLAKDYADMTNAQGADYTAMIAATDIANKATLTSKIDKLHSAMALDLAQKGVAAGTTDKAALKAVQAEIDAFNDLHDADEVFEKAARYTDKTVANALTKIRDNELKAVIDAINALPVNITEADRAAVENARKLYDAFVKDWTQYEAYNDYNAAAQVTNFRDLALAEATLGLNAEDPAMAVKAFKIKASSKATKGAMTIKWRVIDGDKSAAAGYQVWRSTKANKGFKKMITTKKMTYKNTKNLKKGTTYYYRVRAYARTAEGKLVFSDFSNKAYRKAK